MKMRIWFVSFPGHQFRNMMNQTHLRSTVGKWRRSRTLDVGVKGQESVRRICSRSLQDWAKTNMRWLLPHRKSAMRENISKLRELQTAKSSRGQRGFIVHCDRKPPPPINDDTVRCGNAEGKMRIRRVSGRPSFLQSRSKFTAGKFQTEGRGS